MSETRWKNATFDLTNNNGGIEWSKVPIAVLYDIRDELQTLNRLLSCENFLQIPRVLRAIRSNTSKPRKKKRKVAT